MCRTLISIILDVLVKKHGISVIATTHAPATVAIAPEDSLYVMLPDQPGLHKISKAQALNILTIGVPTLSLAFDGRRQVFVESPIDSEIYDAMYQILKPTLASERSLQFISAGGTPSTGNEGQTGSSAVRYIVNQLQQAGNSSVFGLIDWDGTNSPSGRLRVLAHSRRNGLENILLDPLLLTTLLVRDFKEVAFGIGFPSRDLYPRIQSMSAEGLQSLIDIVQCRVFPAGEATRHKVKYVQGFSLEVDERFLLTDDHKLEQTVVDVFPQLQEASKKQAGRLMKYIVDRVVNETPGFVPVELLDDMNWILSQQSH